MARQNPTPNAGPVLFARGATGLQLHLAAVIVLDAAQDPPDLRPEVGRDVAPVALHHPGGQIVWCYEFALPVQPEAAYELGGRRYPVASDLTGAVRIAFVSCNGQESGDRERHIHERNALWRELHAEHDRQPFHLLLHGGDQIYADEILDAHPDLQRWREASPDEQAAMVWGSEHAEAAESFLFQRYVELLTHPELAYLAARVPSVMMWDDHDIFDGWGSHPRVVHDSPVAQGLFSAARSYFRIFQQGDSPDPVADDADPPPLGQGLRFPGFGVVAPDLRSQRLPDRVMAESGWGAFEGELAELGEEARLLVLSSVPALGPRLSLVERILQVIPGGQKYEDDLRDQWQSPAHRAEWGRFLETLLERLEVMGQAVTVLSGEIHLATRGELSSPAGTLHQLVASGVAHPPPPKLWARTLGLRARIGETPLPGHPIRMKPLPGQQGIYTAERNFLVLERTGESWSVTWRLEGSGWTDVLAV
ncbi:MAG: alkaline phosphatase D family protein [Thiohalorhabdus sp.]|uniref:alkaline phosphatase D family protein n=1 Tax=Thiohalorhabdus sp. TaxID=3094134 RepID=UPI002FC35973